MGFFRSLLNVSKIISNHTVNLAATFIKALILFIPEIQNGTTAMVFLMSAIKGSSACNRCPAMEDCLEDHNNYLNFSKFIRKSAINARSPPIGLQTFVIYSSWLCKVKTENALRFEIVKISNIIIDLNIHKTNQMFKIKNMFKDFWRTIYMQYHCGIIELECSEICGLQVQFSSVFIMVHRPFRSGKIIDSMPASVIFLQIHNWFFVCEAFKELQPVFRFTEIYAAQKHTIMFVLCFANKIWI